MCPEHIAESGGIEKGMRAERRGEEGDNEDREGWVEEEMRAGEVRRNIESLGGHSKPEKVANDRKQCPTL